MQYESGLHCLSWSECRLIPTQFNRMHLNHKLAHVYIAMCARLMILSNVNAFLFTSKWFNEILLLICPNELWRYLFFFSDLLMCQKVLPMVITRQLNALIVLVLWPTQHFHSIAQNAFSQTIDNYEFTPDESLFIWNIINIHKIA